MTSESLNIRKVCTSQLLNGRPEVIHIPSTERSKVRISRITHVELKGKEKKKKKKKLAILRITRMWCTFLLVLLMSSFLRHSRIWKERLAHFKVVCISWPANQMFYLFFNSAVIILVTSTVHMLLCVRKFLLISTASWLLFFIWKLVYFLSLISEILILGCGRYTEPVNPELRQFIRSTGMKLEAVDTVLMVWNYIGLFHNWICLDLYYPITEIIIFHATENQDIELFMSLSLIGGKAIYSFFRIRNSISYH